MRFELSREISKARWPNPMRRKKCEYKMKKMKLFDTIVETYWFSLLRETSSIPTTHRVHSPRAKLFLFIKWKKLQVVGRRRKQRKMPMLVHVTRKRNLHQLNLLFAFDFHIISCRNSCGASAGTVEQICSLREFKS